MVPLPPLRDGARALPISSFRQSMPSFDTRCPGLHLQPGASVVLGCVGELPGSRCTDFNPRARVRRDELFADLGITNAIISIHAPRVGRDIIHITILHRAKNFNPRAPCGARPCRPSSLPPDLDFNPRAPCGARRIARFSVATQADFNPRAPCGARLWIHNVFKLCFDISIHAPRVGRDASALCSRREPHLISIHAPRVGRDSIFRRHKASIMDFNPRAPCGARLSASMVSHADGKHFNPRAPCGARHSRAGFGIRDQYISIHAPRVGRDRCHV